MNDLQYAQRVKMRSASEDAQLQEHFGRPSVDGSDLCHACCEFRSVAENEWRRLQDDRVDAAVKVGDVGLQALELFAERIEARQLKVLEFVSGVADELA